MVLSLLYKGLIHYGLLLCSYITGISVTDGLDLLKHTKMITQSSNEEERNTGLVFWKKVIRSLDRIVSIVPFNLFGILLSYTIYFYMLFPTIYEDKFILQDEGRKTMRWLFYVDMLSWMTSTILNTLKVVDFVRNTKVLHGTYTLVVHPLIWTVKLMNVSIPWILIRPHWITFIIVTTICMYMYVWSAGHSEDDEKGLIHDYLYNYRKTSRLYPFYNRGMFGMMDWIMGTYLIHTTNYLEHEH